MEAHDFWNLAGRAGRWGHDFQGNIICIDTKNKSAWPEGVPARTRLKIEHETDQVLSRNAELVDFIKKRWDLETAELLRNPKLEQVSAYLLSVWMREGSIARAPWAHRHNPHRLAEIDESLAQLAPRISIPADLVGRHVGVSAVGMQRLLESFRKRKKPVEELPPLLPESDEAWSRLIAIFSRVNRDLYPAFMPAGRVPLHALTSVDWMRGLSLARIIQSRINYHTKRGHEVKLPQTIRDTMQMVEEIARFKAPKYLSCYLDVLHVFLKEIDRLDVYPESHQFDLYLEFGVSARTLISLIELGLSRMSAVELYERIVNPDLGPEECLLWVKDRAAELETLDIPQVILREIKRKLVDRD
jgi:hypothetical protein